MWIIQLTDIETSTLLILLKQLYPLDREEIEGANVLMLIILEGILFYFRQTLPNAYTLQIPVLH